MREGEGEERERESVIQYQYQNVESSYLQSLDDLILPPVSG